MEIARVTGVCKRYRSLRALNGVSFGIRRGEVLGVIGPNGSGKTTLFECLGGVLPADAGRVELAPGLPPHSLFYIPDGIAPWPDQPVRWILEYVAGLFGEAAGARRAVFDAFELAPLLDQRLGHLSKGQRKRVLLAIGLLTPRPVVLADEPFDGLDIRQTRDVAAALRRCAAQGRTLVLSIHQIADAGRVCDRYVLLSGGTVRGEGTLNELASLAASRHGAAVAGLEEAFLALT